MFKTLVTSWKLPEIRKKLLFTILLIVIFRFGAYVPVPGVDIGYIQSAVSQFDISNYLDLITGGSFAHFTVFALGISPYIQASIIMQLLTIAIPSLENMQKEGEHGRKRIEKITRYLGVLFSLVLAFGYTFAMGQNARLDSNILNKTYSLILITLTLAAGSTFLMWLSELITESGIGNGSSFIIFVGIVSKLPDMILQFGESVKTNILPWWSIPLTIIAVLFIIMSVVFIDLGERKVRVQYSKRQVGRKMYGGQSTYIPIRVNANGVMPLIFAMTLVQLPQMISGFLKADNGFRVAVESYFSAGSALYMIVYALLILAFSYFYTMITFNPIELSKNLQAQGGFVPGIRPGKPTSDYLAQISSRLTLVSAIYLALLATLPQLLPRSMSFLTMFGPTSLLIMVSVALETQKQLQAQISMRHYKGFLK